MSRDLAEEYQALLDLRSALQTRSRVKLAALHEDISLYDHQKQGVNKFIGSNGNIILAHGTGSGKTLTAISAFEEGKKRNIADKALVVVPASLRNNFLENGVHKYTTSTGVIYGNKSEIGKGTHSNIDTPSGADYHIVSAELFRRNPEQWVNKIKPDTIIYDELHRAKDESGLTFDAIKRVRPLHRNFIGMTGSFISNSPSDIVPLVDAMTNGNHYLGTRGEFQRRYIQEDKNGKKKIKNLNILMPLLSHYIDYFGSDQMKASDLPGKIVDEVFIEMSPKQHQLFNFTLGKIDPVILSKLKQDISSLSEKEIGHVFSKITHARKISNSIHTLDDRMTPEESAKSTPKVKRLLDDVEQHLKETPDGQAILYSNLVHGGVDVLRAGLRERNIDHGVFMGKKEGFKESDRQKAVDDFKSSKTRALVVSAAGAEGLDLPNTTFFAALDGHFNPERILQSEARGIRAGGLAHRPQDKRKVLVRRYISISPRGTNQTSSGGLWDSLGSMFWNRPAVEKKQDTLDVPSIDNWIYEIAKRKHYLNQEIRDELRKTGALISTDAKSLREEYHDMFPHLLKGKNPDRTKLVEGEKNFFHSIRNSAKAKLLSPFVQELINEALATAPGDPRLLMILALLYKKSQGLNNVSPEEAQKILGLSDNVLRKLIRGDLSPLKQVTLEGLE